MDTINGVVRVWNEKSQKWIPDCYPIPMPEIIDSLRGLEQSMRTALVRATPLDRQERDQAMLRETVYQSLQSLRSLRERLEPFRQHARSGCGSSGLKTSHPSPG